MELRAVKGMNDILPEEIGRWHRLETTFRRVVELYGYREVRTPIVEPTQLFVRSIGEATDVVEKEMYSFRRHDDDLTLRPEGTAGAARAYLEHKVHAREPVSRWYYLGPMFRGERPARGRYRQFYQAGAELYGEAGPLCDAEMIDMLARFLQQLGLHQVEVLINSLGGPTTRQRYRQALVDFFTPRADQLSDDSRRRLEKNPLRILDSKAASDQALCAEAPSILDVLDDDDQAHFDGLRRYLDVPKTPYRVDPRLVRGLDYYTRTLFELRGTGGELGAQNALGGGGRYDHMIRELGGPDTPCIGFALGLERLLLAMEPEPIAQAGWVYVAPLGEAAQREALRLATELREAGIEARVDGRGQKLNRMLPRASSSGARFCVILGDGELERGIVALKDLATHTQEEPARDRLLPRLRELLGEDAR
ncbi:MAG: histidine--tRNA ligase [Myxococcales bacterium]|nr:histidine--tRNA ligase [Polyangiaceae bacterium]MDW8250279.1 histidine--tRNA ligase [Myxococcales bacterium]